MKFDNPLFIVAFSMLSCETIELLGQVYPITFFTASENVYSKYNVKNKFRFFFVVSKRKFPLLFHEHLQHIIIWII